MILVLAIVLFWPIPYTAAPKWEVWAVNEVGAPLEGMTVRLYYQNYSAEMMGSEMDAVTDSHGHAQFPMQLASASAARYIVYSYRSAMAGVHASFGRHAGVFAYGQGRDGSATTGDAIQIGLAHRRKCNHESWHVSVQSWCADQRK